MKRSNMVLPRPVVVMDRDYARSARIHRLFAAGVTGRPAVGAGRRGRVAVGAP
ncbi:hypothetical protein [Brachybacterium sacelli]|uniref:hypothetical protein n=1 Tax=Brachybacterium sacelli TaxID=173364 RepID=UPI00361D7BCF